MPTEGAQGSTMTTKDTDIKLPMTELQIMADIELEEKQKLDGPSHTVDTINNVSSFVIETVISDTLFLMLIWN